MSRVTVKSLYNLMSKTQLENEIIILETGCNSKVDMNGDCWYISSQGNKRFCSSCTRKLKIANEMLVKK